MSSCSSFRLYLSSSIGKKQIMGLSGLALCVFLIGHLTGNMLLLLGPDAFNTYAHTLTSNKPLLYGAEAGLILVFLTHLFLAIKLTIENKLARPVAYHSKKRTGRGATFASSTMPITGLITLVFIVLHLMSFKYGTYYSTYLEGEEVRDLYKTVIEYFNNPLYVAWYVFAMVSLGLHLSHGFQSAFQSVGVNHGTYTPIIKKLGCFFSIVITIGFSALAIWSHFQN